MLRAENVSFKIHNKILLHETSVSFESNKFHVIMGANGAGKSTLLKLLAGSEKLSTGKVLLNEKELSSYPEKDLAKQRAVLSQHYNISFPIAVNNVVMMGRYPYFGNVASVNDHTICDEAMKLMQVEEFAERDYSTLSGGESQKVMMSRVLAQIWDAKEGEEKLLFLDEPVSHLDVKYQHQLMQVAKSFCNKHVTVIAVLHDINLALKFADRILFMKKGNIVCELNNVTELDAAIVEEVFDVKARILQTGESKIVLFE